MLLLHPLLGLDRELALLVWNDAVVMDAVLVAVEGGKGEREGGTGGRKGGREGGRDRRSQWCIPIRLAHMTDS